MLLAAFCVGGCFRMFANRVGMPPGRKARPGKVNVVVWHMCTMFAGISPLPDDVFMHFAKFVVCLARQGRLRRKQAFPLSLRVPLGECVCQYLGMQPLVWIYVKVLLFFGKCRIE